jgi:CRISPR-associated protein Csd2
MTIVQNRYDFVLLFDVQDGNPNGDPDAGNMPRFDPETGQGLVTDVAIKRKIRNFVALSQTDAEGRPRAGYRIYVQEGAILNRLHEEAYRALGLDPKAKKAKNNKESAQAKMCETFFDVRTFGAVMSTGDADAGQVRGPLQLTFARSIDPIFARDFAITRMAVTNEKDAEKERTIGRKHQVAYGLYRAHGFISPSLAGKTGFSEDDLKILRRALRDMFEHDRSAARGLMTTRRVIAFRHESKLGTASASALFDRVRVARHDSTTSARAWSDYEVSVDDAHLPAGIAIEEW